MDKRRQWIWCWVQGVCVVGCEGDDDCADCHYDYWHHNYYDNHYDDYYNAECDCYSDFNYSRIAKHGDNVYYHHDNADVYHYHFSDNHNHHDHDIRRNHCFLGNLVRDPILRDRG